MSVQRNTPKGIRQNHLSQRRIASAAVRAVEILEPRQLLSAVVTTFPIPVSDSSYWDGSSAHIVAGPDGNEWFTDPANAAIGKVTPAGVVTEYPLPVHNAPLDDGSGQSGPDDPEPSDIVVGPNGNLWFTETGVDRIGEITTAGVITEFKTPAADSNPQGIAVGADGNLWFAESGSEAIGRITPAGAIKEFPLDNNIDVSYDDGIATGSDGNVWFIADDSDGNGLIARITPGGNVVSFPLDSSPTTLAAGPDGNLWVGADDGTISKVTTAGIATSFSVPNGPGISSIRAGTDGNLYFTTWGNNSLGRITTAGVMSEFSLPGSSDAGSTSIQPGDISQSSDGKLWYVDSYNPDVGVIDLSNALLASSTYVTATAGASTTSTFASFVDFSGNSTAADYTATVTLSDGTVLPAAIDSNSNGGFDVSATNSWTIGYDNVTVTITDTRDTSRIATAMTSVSVAAPTATGTGINLTTTSGQLFSGSVATFTGVALNSVSQYSASIDWGDGHDTAGTITVNADGGFDIAGSNRYADVGTYTVTTTLSPFSGGIVPYEGPIGVGPVTPIVAPVTTPVTGVTIGTADGSVVPGTVVDSNLPVSTPPVIIHTPAIGIHTNPSIPGTGGNASAIAFPYFGGGATATSTATVAAGVADGTGFSVQATSTTAFTGDVASFTLADPNADLSHLHATVQWNDPGIRNWFFSLSNDPSTGIITPDGNGGLTVSTSSSFANSGLYHFVVQITDDRLGTGDSAIVAVAYGQIVVDSPFRWLPIFESNAATPAVGTGAVSNTSAAAVASNPVLGEKVKPISISPHTLASQTFTGSVGALKGIVTGTAGLADLTGTIHWGDGTTSTATFTGGKNKQVVVGGSHNYSSAGNYAISVDVNQTLYVNGEPSTLYPLNLPTIESAAKVSAGAKHAYITTGGIAISAVHGTAFTAPVASFAASAPAAGVTRSATIFWGDGTHSAGAITTDSSNELTVTASHTYKKTGKHTVWISVTQKSTPGASTKVPRILAYIKTSAVVS